MKFRLSPQVLLLVVCWILVGIVYWRVRKDAQIPEPPARVDVVQIRTLNDYRTGVIGHRSVIGTGDGSILLLASGPGFDGKQVRAEIFTSAGAVLVSTRTYRLEATKRGVFLLPKLTPGNYSATAYADDVPLAKAVFTIADFSDPTLHGGR